MIPEKTASINLRLTRYYSEMLHFTSNRVASQPRWLQNKISLWSPNEVGLLPVNAIFHSPKAPSQKEFDLAFFIHGEINRYQRRIA